MRLWHPASKLPLHGFGGLSPTLGRDGSTSVGEPFLGLMALAQPGSFCNNNLSSDIIIRGLYTSALLPFLFLRLQFDGE